MRKSLPGHNKLVRRLAFCICACVLLVLLSAPRVYRELFLDQPLWLAAQKGQTAEVKRLLAAGADPNARWEDGSSVLHVAQGRSGQGRGLDEMMRVLKEAGAKE